MTALFVRVWRAYSPNPQPARVERRGQTLDRAALAAPVPPFEHDDTAQVRDFIGLLNLEHAGLRRLERALVLGLVRQALVEIEFSELEAGFDLNRVGHRRG